MQTQTANSSQDYSALVADYMSRGGKVQVCPTKNLGSRNLRRNKLLRKVDLTAPDSL